MKQDYRTQYIVPPKIARRLIKDAMKICYNVRTDQLDCSVSWARQPTDKTPDDVLKMTRKKNASTLWSFIYRTGVFGDVDHWDVGCCVYGGKKKQPEYFLWIKLDEESGLKLIKKYKLRKHGI